MGPQDHLRALPDGMGCTVCEERVPAGRIRLLARRDDLLFLQLDCAACGSSSLGFVIVPVADGVAATPAGPAPGRPAGGPPVSHDDVLDMHRFLESWAGDLETIVRGGTGRPDREDHRPARPAPGRTGRPA
jgi:hypothetical protein